MVDYRAMKIMFFSDHFHPEPSAPAAHVYERARLWVEGGNHVTVICSAPNFPEGKVYPGYRNAWRQVEILNGIRVLRIKTFVSANEGTFRRTVDYASYMLSAWFFSLFEAKPDVVISTSPHLFVPVAGVFSAMCRRVPHVFEIRDLWPASIAATSAVKQSKMLQALERVEIWLYRRSARILALTPSFKTDLVERGIPDHKIDVVINGANLALFRPSTRPNEAIVTKYQLNEKFVIGYLGTVGLAHGLDNVLKAADTLRDTRICFFIVGVGAAKKKLETQTAEMALENVVFAPRQNREDMPKFWSVCNASLVHLKDSAIFSTVIPSKIFESMAVGLPILYSVPEGDGSAIVRQHDVGIVVAPMQPAELSRAAVSLADDPSLCRRLGANGASAAKHYSRDVQAMKSFDVLKRAAARD